MSDEKKNNTFSSTPCQQAQGVPSGSYYDDHVMVILDCFIGIVASDLVVLLE